MLKDNLSRYEFKFPISYDDMDRLMDDLIPYVKSDKHVNEYGIYTISSLYMENDCKDCYYETINGDPFRQKVRLRVYGKQAFKDSDAFLELKNKINGLVVKRRINMKLSDAVNFMNDCAKNGNSAKIESYKNADSQILKEIRQVIATKKLKPAVIVSYERLPLVAIDDESLRITFDFNLRSRSDALDQTEGTGGLRRCPKNVAILEIKTNKPLPYWLTKILAKYNYRNQTFSKYCSHYSPMRILSDIKIDNEGDTDNDKHIHTKFN